MTTTDFINDCAKCIDMCKKEYSSEFTEWIEKLILTEIAGDSDTKNDVDDKKNKTKELSIKSIKEELMDALLGDMRIINSFSNKGEKKAKDYIGRNIFGHLNENASCGYADTFINFDVMKVRGCYDVFINIKEHSYLFKKEAVNCLDDISECIEEIVNELYPYHKSYSDVTVDVVGDDYVRRNIRFTLRPIDKDGYEKSLENNSTDSEDCSFKGNFSGHVCK